MYVLDDYIEGVIYAGKTKEDLLTRLPVHFPVNERILNKLENAYEFIISDYEGFAYYIMQMESKELFEYMEERGAFNFIKGV